MNSLNADDALAAMADAYADYVSGSDRYNWWITRCSN
jgi:hypothetical protein